MPKYIDIKLINPCEQEWESMKPVAGGSFCDSCQKKVIDFTAMTDNQLLEFFKNNTSDGCGKFYTDQLMQPLVIPPKKIPWLKYMLQISLPALLLSLKTNAQRIIKHDDTSIQLVDKRTSTAQPVTVSGQVTSSPGSPVPYASIAVPGTSRGVVADENGAFTIELDEKHLTIEVSAVGFENKLAAVTGQQECIKLEIKARSPIVLNALVVIRTTHTTAGGYMSVRYRSSRSGKKVQTISKKPAFEIFPNPVDLKGLLTIRWMDPIKNDQQVSILNSAGQQIMHHMLSISQQVSQSQLRLNLSSAGTYFLKVTDGKTGKVQVVPFVSR